MNLTIARDDAEERSCVAIGRLRVILEWVGFIGFMGLVLVGMVLACVFYPLIRCAQWASRRKA